MVASNAVDEEVSYVKMLGLFKYTLSVYDDKHHHCMYMWYMHYSNSIAATVKTSAIKAVTAGHK